MKPLYRRQSQVEGVSGNAHEAVEAPSEVNGVKVSDVQIKQEPDSSHNPSNRVNPFGDPYEFSDGQGRENGSKVFKLTLKFECLLN